LNINKKIVVSGITSSIGISLAKLLVQKGYKVLGFSRKIERAQTALQNIDVELISGDILDEDFLFSICKDTYGIIHLAAFSSPWGRYKDFYSTNVSGTKHLLNAAYKNNIDRFVHVSTPSIYFDYQDKYLIRESDPLPQEPVNYYAYSKILAEDLVDKAQQNGLSTITIRPRAVFGPYDQTLLPRILNMCRTKGILQFRKNSPVVDVSYVDNVAYALYLALESPSNCVGQKYNITNGEPVKLWELMQILLDEMDLSYNFKRVPYSIAYFYAYLSELIANIRGKEPVVTRYGIGVMSYSQTLSIEKAKKELSYQPQISLKEGIKHYVKWFQTT